LPIHGGQVAALNWESYRMGTRRLLAACPDGAILACSTPESGLDTTEAARDE